MSLFSDEPVGDPDEPRVLPQAGRPPEPTWRQILLGRRKKPMPPGWYPHGSLAGWEKRWNGGAWTGETRRRGSEVPQPGAVGRFLDRQVEAQNELEAARAKIVCQFCQQAGNVTVSHVKKNTRLSATRIAGAIATTGGSMLLTGVRKKNHWTRLTCSNCQMSWDLAD